MPSEQCNLTMAKTADLIFSLFDIDSAQEVLCGISEYIQYILHALTSGLLCVPFIFADSVNLVVASDGFLFLMEIFILTTLITQLLFKYQKLAMKRNGYFAFQTIIDILGHMIP